MRRLFRWLKDQGVTSIITAERGDGVLTRHGLEEYVSDCVILLDHRVADQVATRRLRVVKYRGASHGTNEYPFLIDDSGICVLPVTSVELAHDVSNERVPTGVAGLDAMLGGKGFWRGSSILVSGMAGTGKSTLAAAFRRRRLPARREAIYFAFEESPHQIVRNMSSVGVDLQPGSTRGCCASRPPGRPSGGSRCISPGCTRRSSDFAPSGRDRSDLQSERRRLATRGARRCCCG